MHQGHKVSGGSMKAMNNKGKVKKWYKLINGQKQRFFESNITSRRTPDPRIDSSSFSLLLLKRQEKELREKFQCLSLKERLETSNVLIHSYGVIYKRNIVLDFRGSSLLYCDNIVSYGQNDHTHQTIMVWFEYIGKWINCLWTPEFLH